MTKGYVDVYFKDGAESREILSGMGELYGADECSSLSGYRVYLFRWDLGEKVVADFIQQFAEDCSGFDFVEKIHTYCEGGGVGTEIIPKARLESSCLDPNPGLGKRLAAAVSAKPSSGVEMGARKG